MVRLLRSKKLEAKENNLAYTSMYISKLGCLRMPFFSVKSLGISGPWIEIKGFLKPSYDKMVIGRRKYEL